MHSLSSISVIRTQHSLLSHSNRIFRTITLMLAFSWSFHQQGHNEEKKWFFYPNKEVIVNGKKLRKLKIDLEDVHFFKWSLIWKRNNVLISDRLLDGEEIVMSYKTKCSITSLLTAEHKNNDASCFLVSLVVFNETLPKKIQNFHFLTWFYLHLSLSVEPW